MQNPSIGFIGGGRITRILLEGMARGRALPASITVADPGPHALSELRIRVPGILTSGEASKAAAQDIVFLALHPPVLLDTLPRIKATVRPTALVVSLAPKITFAQLSSALGGFTRLARLIPNAPSLVGMGYNPVAFAPGLAADAKASLLRLLAPLGESPEVPEHKLEAYALISAMGPTFFWYQLQCLREQAAQFGLTGSEADAAIERMINGAARTLMGSGLTPAEVMNLVPTKPLADVEPQVLSMMRTRLPELFQKIKP